jgi:hypothetical protein
MFDPITTALIRTAPPLEGLDLEALPKRLTEAFADIVSARIRLRSAGVEDVDPEADRTLNELRRLAAAHESYVALLPERENRGAAAFVAAAAHQACMLRRGAVVGQSRIDAAAVTPEICATLLFLVAEANADAAEAANRIVANPQTSSPVERALLLAIRNLAQGRLLEIVRQEIPEIAGVETETRRACAAGPPANASTWREEPCAPASTPRGCSSVFGRYRNCGDDFHSCEAAKCRAD